MSESDGTTMLGWALLLTVLIPLTVLLAALGAILVRLAEAVWWWA